MSRNNKNIDDLIRSLDPYERVFNAKISRRTMLLGALGTAAIYVLSDQDLANRNWADKQDKVAVLDEYTDTTSEGMWLVGPGLGVQSSEGIASTLKTSLGNTAPIAYMQMSDGGLSLDALAYQTEKLIHEREVTKLYLLGHSMGSLTVTQVVDRIGAKAEIFICDGSPFDINDVKDENLTIFIKWLVERYRPGFVSKLIGEVINSTIRDPNPNLGYLDQLKDAYRVSGSGVSPKVWANQIELLGNMDTGAYKKVTTESTHTAYMQPKDPDNDKVVKVLQANGRYDTAFGGNMRTLEMETFWHASPTDFPGQYNQTIASFLENIRNKDYTR